MKLLRVCNPKPCLPYTCSLVCDKIDFICDFKLFKAINRNYFDVSGNLIAIPWFIDYAFIKENNVPYLNEELLFFEIKLIK